MTHLSPSVLTVVCLVCRCSPEPAGDGVLSAGAAGAALQRGRQTLAAGPLSHPETPRWETHEHVVERIQREERGVSKRVSLSLQV